MPETIRLYELVYIIAPDRSEEQVQAVIDKYNNLIASQGGTVDKTDIWERRRLAYEINGYNEGLYVVATFRGTPSVEAELRRVFRISEDTLRSIIVRPGEETTLPEPASRASEEGSSRRAPRAPAAPRQPDFEAQAETAEPAVTAEPAEAAEAAQSVETVESPEAAEETEPVEATA